MKATCDELLQKSNYARGHDISLQSLANKIFKVRHGPETFQFRELLCNLRSEISLIMTRE